MPELKRGNLQQFSAGFYSYVINNGRYVWICFSTPSGKSTLLQPYINKSLQIQSLEDRIMTPREGTRKIHLANKSVDEVVEKACYFLQI